MDELLEPSVMSADNIRSLYLEPSLDDWLFIRASTKYEISSYQTRMCL